VAALALLETTDLWAYNINIEVEAAKAGFDEIQFDYVRLPDASGLAYEAPWTEQNREAAIDGFLSEARKALTPSTCSGIRTTNIRPST
jgi:hypothetical protein